MIHVKEAVQKASGYLTELYGSKAFDILLEEVEYNDSDQQWLITVGFTREVAEPMSEFTPTLSLFVPQIKREYKQIMVDAETGEVQAMKIRPVPVA